MKYFKRISVTLFAILFFVFIIKNISLENFQAVASPDNLSVPAQGTWEITDYKLYSGSQSDEGALQELLGKKAVFSRNFAYVADKSCEAPKYSVKNVNTEQYMAFTRNISVETGITKAKSEVISVSSGEKHFFDLFLIDEKKLALLSNGGMVFLTKVSDEAPEINNAESVSSSASGNNNTTGKGLSSSGVLLGIKTTIPPDNSSNIPSYKYRTLWIGRDQNNIIPAKETENLLVPRITGFWKLDADRISANGILSDKILSYPLESNISRNYSNRGSADNTFLSNLQNITFVGNDFISLEYGLSLNNKSVVMNKLKIVPLSTPEQGKIKISDIFGEKAKDALVNSSKISANSNNAITDAQNYVAEEDNIGMFRKNGHWVLKGRMDYEGSDSQKSFKDFYISLIPEKKLVNYDNLTISWSDVKSIVPEALDIFESPNSDFAVIVTKNNLCIYDINNNILAQTPCARYKIGENDTIIMSEWSTGDYTWKWDKTMEALGKSIN